MPPKPIRFSLDENLPPNVARALSLVGYPISHPEDHAKRGAKDPVLITWLAENQFVWITPLEERTAINSSGKGYQSFGSWGL